MVVLEVVVSQEVTVRPLSRYLYIVDRLKELIITGGENIYPREVEEALYAKPEVEECALIVVPDKEWGETCECLHRAENGPVSDSGGAKVFPKFPFIGLQGV